MESATVAHPQHLAALARANKIRLARAERKREIHRKERTAGDLVRECPEELKTITLLELLTSQRRWGRVRARKLCVNLGLGEHKKLGTLTGRQRNLLAAALEESVGQQSVSDPLLGRVR